MKVGVLYSGGKDSNYALFLASKEYEISVLINIIPRNNESYLYHFINNEITELQSKALEIPLERYYVDDDELKTLKKALNIVKEKYKIEGIVSGAIRSTYQYERFKKVCEDLDLKFISPLWKINEKKYLYDLIKNNFDIIITGWYAYPFDKEILGKRLDENLIKKLIEYNEKYGINLVGEGGEYETTVLYQPLFKKRIVIDDYEIKIYKNYGEYLIKKAHLE